MTVAQIAPEIDRLVWAVNGRTKANLDLRGLDMVGLSSAVVGLLSNLVPFLDDLTEAFVHRRYLYMDPVVVDSIVGDLVSAGVMTRHGAQLAPTPLMAPIRDEFIRSQHEAVHHFWDESEVSDLSAMARRVLDASPAEYGMAQLARTVAEPDDHLQCFHQRLAALRLLRNESHVAAWRAHELEPADIEMLTSAFSGSDTQSPPTSTKRLVERGLAENGVVTAEGLTLRQSIEDETNAGVASSFAAIDSDAFLTQLAALPS